MKEILTIYGLLLAVIHNILVDVSNYIGNTAKDLDKYIDDLDYQIATPEERIHLNHVKSECYKSFWKGR